MIISQQAGNAVGFMVAAVLMLFVMLLIFAGFLSLFRPWFRAFMSATPISLFDVLGMKLRKVNANYVISQGIAANQAGFPIDWAELERAYLTGVDLETVVMAYITTKKRDQEYSFEELVDAARESRLKDMLP